MESKQVRISLAFHTLMHFYAGFSGQASKQHFASSPKMSVSESPADADVAVEAAPWDRQVPDSASERPSEAAFQAALIPSIDDNQFETTKASVLEKLAALQIKYGTLSAYLQKRFADPVDLQAFLIALVDMAQAEKPLWTLQAKLRASSSPDDCISFDKNCSVKPDADHQLVLDLAERFMLEGFLSSTEPVIVLQTAELIQVADHAAGAQIALGRRRSPPAILARFLERQSSGTHTSRIDVDLCGQQHRSQAGVLADLFLL